VHDAPWYHPRRKLPPLLEELVDPVAGVPPPPVLVALLDAAPPMPPVELALLELAPLEVAPLVLAPLDVAADAVLLPLVVVLLDDPPAPASLASWHPVPMPPAVTSATQTTPRTSSLPLLVELMLARVTNGAPEAQRRGHAGSRTGWSRGTRRSIVTR
jgi:hypothetical protein